MPTERRSTLSVQQRLDILQDLAKYQSISVVAEKYRMRPAAIRRIKRNLARISEFASKNKLYKSRQRLRKPLYEELEHRLFTWFTERKTCGGSVTDALLLAKAAELKEKIPACSRFKVSKGWLANFKRRNAIRLLNMYPENDDTNGEDAATTFVENLKKLIDEENIHLENVYNMDDTVLAWKALPVKILADTDIKDECDNAYKIRKERVTVALCTNALGTHKIMPLLINKYENPRSLKHCKYELPVIFKSQGNVSMDRFLFVDWLENYFKPSVRAFQLQKQICGKVILLLGNGELYDEPIAAREDKGFKVICLPPNTLPLIQPMHQGIIEKTKRLYRQKMLQSAIKYRGNVSEFCKDYTIRDCINTLHHSWTEINSDVIKNAWHKIIASPTLVFVKTEERDPLQYDLQDLISTVTGERSTEGNVNEFLIACERAESKNLKKGEVDQANGCESNEYNNESDDEDTDKVHETSTNQQDQYDDSTNELKYIFGRLTFHAANAPRFVQLMLEALKDYFLSDTIEK